MNNRKNDDTSAAGYVLAFAGLVAVCMIIVLYTVAAFASLILTLLCLAAWNEPRTIGKWTVEPEFARGFLTLAIIGAIGLPFFVLFADVLLGLVTEEGLTLPRRWLIPCSVFGYIAGSLGFVWYRVEQQEKETLAPPPALPEPTTRPDPAHSFSFASWRDEELED